MLRTNELSRLSSWLRCYPVAGRETECKLLTEAVEKALKESADNNGIQIPEWMGEPSNAVQYEHECPRCHSLFNQHAKGCIRREAQALPPDGSEAALTCPCENGRVEDCLEHSQEAAEASDNCRPDGAPILCGAELRVDLTDEFAATYKCVLAQGHERKCHKTWDGKLFR